MKTTSLYRSGILCNLYIPALLVVMFLMAMTKNEGAAVIAILGGMFIMPGIGASVVWMCVFFSKYSSKEVLIKDYKFPLTLACINALAFMGILAVQILTSFFGFYYQYL